jgi:hypothetical protein
MKENVVILNSDKVTANHIHTSTHTIAIENMTRTPTKKPNLNRPYSHGSTFPGSEKK